MYGLVMTTSRDRVMRTAQLDREFRTLPDETIADLARTLPEPARVALVRLGGNNDPVLETAAFRAGASRGRMKGALERVAAVLSDSCLADCVELLGENADLPSEEQLRAVLPALVERHGVSTTRLMLASAVAGDAPAAAAIGRVLKTDASLLG